LEKFGFEHDVFFDLILAYRSENATNGKEKKKGRTAMGSAFCDALLTNCKFFATLSYNELYSLKEWGLYDKKTARKDTS
jgi:hypothetical protein